VQILGVAAAGGSPVFARPLAHGADPHRLAWELGYRIVRPLSAQGGGDDLSVTVQVSAHGRPITALGPQRVRQVDPGLKLDPRVEPVRRQRLAAYGIVLSDRGILGTEFSDRTAVPGLWGLPGGGIDPGENPSQTVIREVLEETGQRIHLSHLLDIQTDHWIGRAPNGVIEDFHAVRIIYAATSADPVEPFVQDIGGTTAATAWIRLSEWPRTPWAAGARALLDRHLPTLITTYRYRKNRSAG
jgi:8-oxo-dGTP pyrophosphatase MutT (NUDIX family)